MARETYDHTSGTFLPANGDEDYFYELPEHARLSLIKASGEFPAQGILYHIKLRPSGVGNYKDHITAAYDRVEITMFPPAGAGYINSDGSTKPANLRELIQARVDQGWTLTPDLQTVLFGNVDTEIVS